MARQRNANRDISFNIYRENKAEISTEEIAIITNEKHATIKSWKSRDKWDEKIFGVTPKRGAKLGNVNSLKTGVYVNNEKLNDKKFLSKYLPKVTQNIIDEVKESNMSPLDILWFNIQIQLSSIIRSQKIMHVKNKNDIVKEEKKNEAYKDKGTEQTKVEYEIQFAWDRQERVLNSQSKAMQTLSNMIKQYDDMIHKDWEIATEEQKERLALLKAQKGRLTGESSEIEDIGDIEEEIYGQ